ncbi:CHAT domain-containing protein [Myxococcota bacterium]|nr:CHAT domain-containing protein [Myxococcota bacterium]
MKTRKDDPARLRSLFRMYPYFDAVSRARSRADDGTRREDDVFRLLLSAMDKWARRPSLDEMMNFLPFALNTDEVAWFALIYAAHRWHRDTPGAAPGLVAVTNALARSDVARNKSSALWTALWPRAIELARSLGDGEGARLSRWGLEETFGSTLAGHRDSVTRMRGRDLLLGLRNELEEALAGGLEGKLAENVAFLYGRCLANLGQTYTDIGLHDDSLATLEQALAFHDQAMAVPARMAFVQCRYHSLRMRSTTRKLVAHRLGEDQSDRARTLLDGALADVEAAVALYRQHPAVREIDGEGILRNLASTRMDWVHQRLLAEDLDPTQAARMLEEVEALLTEVRRSTDPRVLVGLAQTELELRQVRGLLDAGQDAIELGDLAVILGSALATRELPGGHGVDGQRARHAVHALHGWASRDDARLPAAMWHMLAEFLAWLEPEEVGLDLLTGAIAAEVTLLSREDGRPHDGWDPVNYFYEALREFDRRLRDPGLTNAERLLYAGWMRRLVQVRYSWSVCSEGRPLSTEEELTLPDRLGSSAWRSDLNFFGAGAVKEDLTYTEQGWRCDLYRTRWQRDAAAKVLEIEALARWVPEAGEWLQHLARGQVTCEVLPHDTPEVVVRQKAAGGEWFTSPDGIMIPTRWTPDFAREQLRVLEAELLLALQVGKDQGWRPATNQSIPLPSAEGVTAWLAAHPAVALLLVGEGPARLCHAAKGGLHWHRVDLPIGHPLSERVGDYIHARDEHSFGSAEDTDEAQAQIACSLSNMEGDPEQHSAKRTSVATPHAAARLGKALDGLLDLLGEVLRPALEGAIAAGVRHLLVLPRGWARHVPWGAVRLRGAVLADRLPVSMVETLADVERVAARRGPTLLYVGGQAGPESPLHVGKLCLTPHADQVAGPLGRDGFEDLARRARVLRVMAHGEALVVFQQSSGIILDEFYPEGHNRYAADEMRALDLRGARRVELWACESGRDDETFRDLFHHDEPGGLDGALLLAGAEVVVSSLWVQYALSAAMIGEAFAVRAQAHPDRSEAEALAWAVSQYRAAMETDGVFASAVEVRLRAGRCSNEEALVNGLLAWRASLGIEMGDAVFVHGDVLAQLGKALPSRSSPRARADDLLGPLRSPVAWAGWKITLRSKEVLWPARG